MSFPAIDLTTLSNVKNWLSANGVAPANTSDDESIGDCITAFSAIFVWRTGHGTQDGEDITVVGSPFVQPVQYTETYDGNGSSRLYLRNTPIVSIVSLGIGSFSVSPSTGWGQGGYVIDGGGSSISLRSGGSNSFTSYSLSGSGYYGNFSMDQGNVAITYTAGYAVTPPDLEMAARKAAALNYKRKDWIGIKSKALAQGAGTTAYEEYEYDPETERLIQFYTRWSIV